MNDGPGDDDRGVVRSWLSSIIRRRGIGSRRRGAARATLHPISSALTPLPDGSGEPWDWAGLGGAGVDARVAPHHLSPDQQRNTVQADVAGMADDGIGPAFGEFPDMAPNPSGSAQPTDHDHRAHETERVHALYTDMTCGLVVLNRRGELVDANDAAQRILGVRLDEMRGQPSSVALWRAIDADDGDPHEGEKLIGATLRTRRPMRATMVHATRPDGRLRWLQVDAVPVREDGDGSPGDGQGPVIVSFIDITAYREATEILRARGVRDAAEYRGHRPVHVGRAPRRRPTPAAGDLQWRRMGGGPFLERGPPRPRPPLRRALASPIERGRRLRGACFAGHLRPG